jgi:hypothetical protein
VENENGYIKNIEMIPSKKGKKEKGNGMFCEEADSHLIATRNSTTTL